LRRGLRRAGLASVTVLAALAMVLAGGALLRPQVGGTRSPGGSSAVDSPPALPEVGPAADLGTAIARAQQRLREVPGDYATWADLGLAYVQQARVTGDPSYYPKAEGALRKSQEVHPSGNPLALVGLAALAAARHDFAGALRLGREAETIDPYSSPARGIVGDALIELGRYHEAFVEIQKMVDLRPGTASYARASYTWELRGDLTRARHALELALDAAPSDDDAGFALFYLGELAFNAGDLRGAKARYDEGLARAAGYVPLRYGEAKVLAAQGHVAQALAAYRSVVARMPAPAYVMEYGDLLASVGDRKTANEQYALLAAEERLLRANGVDVDLELALFDADHGHAAHALAEARATYAVRRGILAEDALAWALHAVGRDSEALPHARAAVGLGLRSATIRYHLGVIEAALGQRPTATADLREALRINPWFSVTQAPKARALLRSLGAA
jgi:tetratricopeptide (TPR) repeat protein